MMHGVPVQERHVLRVAERIGLPRRTNFGRHFDVASVPRPNSSAYTALHLHCHTDLPYCELPPRYQLLHCLRNDATGGESVLVDGFNVVQALRSMDPSAFEILAMVPLDFGFEDEETDIRYRAPAIGLDGDGNIDELRFNTPVMGPLNVPADRMLEVYRAHRRLAALIRDPRFGLRHRFAAGDLVAIDNRRVLHGRAAFDAASGQRHLQGCYVDRDGLFSRMRVLERATGRRETRRPPASPNGNGAATRAFPVHSAPARSPTRPPTGSYAMGGRVGERAGADSTQVGNALAGRPAQPLADLVRVGVDPLFRNLSWITVQGAESASREHSSSRPGVMGNITNWQ